MKSNRKTGFTLVELLAVIVILAIILVIAVPTIMNTIDNSREGALMSSAKLIAASAETKKMTNDTLEISETITCDMVADINTSDYESCTITFDDSGNASVSIKGKGKFEGKYVCNATRSDATVTYESCETSVVSTGVSMLSELLSQESTLNNGLYEPTITSGDTTISTGIRYAGSNPNNYIYFNCKDKDSNNVAYGETNYDYANSCETWRIIGVFDTEKSDGTTEELIKIVRNDSIGSMSWDSSDSTINGGYGVNEWSQADLQTMLNTYYIGTEGSTCTYCNSSSQATCSNDCTSSVTPISSTFLNMVESVVWKTGAHEYTDTIDVETFYNSERGTQDGRKLCTDANGSDYTYCNDTVTRTTEWEGKIGLIYPSDYGYASTDDSCASDIVNSNSTCENNNWLHPSSGYYWTISPLANSDYANLVWLVDSSGSVGNDIALYSYGVRPSLYLKSNVRLTGLGTSNSPYIIET